MDITITDEHGMWQVHPREMKAVGKMDEVDKLRIDEGDMIIIIDGRRVDSIVEFSL